MQPHSLSAERGQNAPEELQWGRIPIGGCGNERPALYAVRARTARKFLRDFSAREGPVSIADVGRPLWAVACPPGRRGAAQGGEDDANRNRPEAVERRRR